MLYIMSFVRAFNSITAIMIPSVNKVYALTIFHMIPDNNFRYPGRAISINVPTNKRITMSGIGHSGPNLHLFLMILWLFYPSL